MSINLTALIGMKNNKASAVTTAKALLLGTAVLALSACGGKSDVVSHDDSADYRDAVALPPLKKPSRQPANPAPVTADTAGKGVPASNDGNNAGPVEGAPGALSPAENPLDDVLTTRIIEAESDAARLQIDGGFEAAWNFVSTRLKGSGITVHNRNQSAGRIAIGCAELDGSATVSKSGGWSLFNKNAKKQDHCALQLVANKKTTTVSVLNRSGIEIAGSSSRDIFARLMDN